MRRADKQIADQRQMDEIIRGSLVCRVALARDNVPYVVPMSFGYDGQAIYLHTAPEGRKIDFFTANPEVCFEFERHVELVRDPETACKWTFRYESVIGYGTLSEIMEPAGKEPALNEIMRQYSGRAWPFEAGSAGKVRVWKIAIRVMTGKQSRPKPVV
jgi:uncharacterized protein